MPSVAGQAKKGGPRIFFEDEEIIPMLYADYYMDYKPDSCFVAEVKGINIPRVLVVKEDNIWSGTGK